MPEYDKQAPQTKQGVLDIASGLLGSGGRAVMKAALRRVGYAEGVEALSPANAPGLEEQEEALRPGREDVRLRAETMAGGGTLAEIAGHDGLGTDISPTDLTLAGPQEILTLLDAMKVGGYDASEQGFIEMLYAITDPPTLSDGDATEQVYDIGSGQLVDRERSEAVLAPKERKNGPERTRRTLASRHAVADNALVERGLLGPGQVVDPVNTYVSQKNYYDDTIGEAMGARRRLAEQYGLDISDRSLDAVAQLGADGQGPNPTEIPDFIADYLTAFYVRSGPSVGWAQVADEHSEATFFGDKPGADQLPDGRLLIDCLAYTFLAATLQQTLTRAGGAQGATSYFIPINTPKHQMGIMRNGDRVDFQNDNHVERLDMTDAELEALDAISAQRRKGASKELVDLSSLPSLANYFEKKRIESKPIYWSDPSGRLGIGR